MQRGLMENKMLDLSEEMDVKCTVAKCFYFFVDGSVADVLCCWGYMIR